MTNAVVPDGLEIDEHPAHVPGGGGLIVGLIAVALVAIFLASGGNETPDPAPEETLPDIDVVLDDIWNRLELPGADPLRTVAYLGAGEGYIAAGDGPQFWWSADGLAWRLGAVPSAGPYHVSGLVGLRDSVVAVGSDTDVTGQSRPAAWHLDADEEWVLDDVPIDGHSALDGVEEALGRVVAWGWKGSPRDFDPDADALVLTSTDGSTWAETSLPEGMRVHAVRFLGNSWHIMGSLGGKPALYQTVNLEDLEAQSSEGLPFGWAMTDAYIENGALIANLLDLGLDRTRQWRLEDDGEWVPHAPQTLNGPVVIRGDVTDYVGVGSGRLWSGATAWADAGLEGIVADVTGNVAVGGQNGQPVVWVRGVDGEPTITVEAQPGAGWEAVTELGNGIPRGPWLVGDAWVVGVGTDWWLVSGGAVDELPDLAGASISRIDRVGEEWVALPAMMWTSDGVEWEQRDEAWPNAASGQGYVAAVTETDRGALAVGLDEFRLWAVAASTDAGRTWHQVTEPVPTTPVSLIRPVPGGFTAMAALPRSTEQIVRSLDGITWEPFMDGDLVAIAEPPAVVTPDGRLVVLDTNDEYPAPAEGVAAVIRGPEGDITVVAGGSLWTQPPAGIVSPPDWVELPLDPIHGLSAADVRPIPDGGEMYVLAVDRGSVRIHHWNPGS